MAVKIKVESYDGEWSDGWYISILFDESFDWGLVPVFITEEPLDSSAGFTYDDVVRIANDLASRIPGAKVEVE